ncbi:hypothetical protein V6N13_104982 [Hibiscus sabdariffa]|uniref:Uncharacterized protein n=1 Tax=Hibiscus sabdariffa TaxID=183260 RepID=A0ABR2SJ00_9ROSI
MTKLQEEVMASTLAEVEAIVVSDDMQIASECIVYNLSLKWTRVQYLKLEGQRGVLGLWFACLICFNYMTCMKLKKMLISNDFELEFSSKFVLGVDSNQLEAVYLVIVGKTKAHQYYSSDMDMTENMVVLIHGIGNFVGHGGSFIVTTTVTKIGQQWMGEKFQGIEYPRAST